MAHHHGDFIVRELQFVQNAMEESDLAAGHAKRIDLRRANQIDFPFPFACAWVPFVAKGNETLRYGPQADHLGMVIRGKGVFLTRLFQQLRVLLGG